MDEQDYQTKTSATDILKQNLIQYTFNLCRRACEPIETLSETTYETGFTRGVKLAKSMLWKYTPDNIRTPIRDMYLELDEKIQEIDNSELSQANKKLSKTTYADMISMQVLEFLLVVLQYSPLSVEYREMEIFGDFQELIQSIRSNKQVKLFSGEINE